MHRTDQKDEWQLRVLLEVNEEMEDKEGGEGETMGRKGKIGGYGVGRSLPQYH